MEEDIPLQNISSRMIGEYSLQVELRPLKLRSGWTHFSIYLKDRTGRISARKSLTGEYVTSPVLDGIHSRGGKGIMAWIEVGSYFPVVHFKDDTQPQQILSLPGTSSDRRLFQILADLIPPGGHLMFAYDVPYESAFHRETASDLLGNVPPVCTPMGKLLFDVGFRLVKDWYLAEGGCEGPRKLWGEKPPDDEEGRRFDRMTFFQVLAFCARRPNENSGEHERDGKRRAMEVMAELRLDPLLSAMRESVVGLYRGVPVSETPDMAAFRTCQRICSYLNWKIDDDEIVDELKRIAGECSASWPSNGSTG
jgi:hypothetical protein